MNVCIYFGENNFKKLSNVVLDDDKQLIQSELVTGLAFYRMRLENEYVEMQNIYSSWSYALFHIDNKLWHCGFSDSKNCDKMSIIFNPGTDDHIASVSCGWNNIAIVTECGKCTLLSTGDFLPLSVNKMSTLKIKNASVGETHIILLSEDLNVYIIESMKSPLSAKQILNNYNIVDISCGKEHTLLLAKNGAVYSFGVGSRGQLGHGDTNSQSKSLVIEALEGIPMKSIAAGGWHSAAVSAFGDLYTWGWNESGQLGFPCSQRMDDTPFGEIEVVCCLPKIVNLKPDVPVKTVSCGSRHSAALSEQGHLWTWGFNSYEQLGLPKCPWIDEPTIVSLPPSFRPQKLKCSFWNTIISGPVDSKRKAPV